MSFITDPIIALFLSLALGFLIGKLRVGPIQLGVPAAHCLLPWQSANSGAGRSGSEERGIRPFHLCAWLFGGAAVFHQYTRWMALRYFLVHRSCLCPRAVGRGCASLHFDVGTAAGLLQDPRRNRLLSARRRRRLPVFLFLRRKSNNCRPISRRPTASPISSASSPSWFSRRRLPHCC